ncbi:TetR/AcrR family transcriptional regulator [Flavihumibacter petaseus]|uniref:Putative TetR family transcriptional regulator n=1 Tax=Flavihumibacter petaseus NBRC 106054 TaxID=1220578 RepID=A0A0E9N1A7_9BACT|nr:TetR family transcriptional regulator [Flavihumibacter petaseus]GAO43135.1 putative TetR family transcriptional regulator [Flavihumibacter petaseus NBRC 106054]
MATKATSAKGKRNSAQAAKTTAPAKAKVSPKPKRPLDSNTESIIKSAARTVFHQKGFAATRTRDIAAAANMNLALLNYYFKSKENLFQIIMVETLSGFFGTMLVVFNDTSTTLEKKITLAVEGYIDLIITEPEVPLFMMSEIRTSAKNLLTRLKGPESILQTVFVSQYQEAVKQGKITEPNPLHFLLNLLGMIMFPFIASPMVKTIAKLSDKQFEKLMLERKQRIPVWVKAMLKAK